MLKVAIRLQVWRSGIQWEILLNIVRQWMNFSERDSFTRLKTVHRTLSLETFAWRANRMISFGLWLVICRASHILFLSCLLMKCSRLSREAGSLACETTCDLLWSMMIIFRSPLMNTHLQVETCLFIFRQKSYIICARNLLLRLWEVKPLMLMSHYSHELWTLACSQTLCHIGFLKLKNEFALTPLWLQHRFI